MEMSAIGVSDTSRFFCPFYRMNQTVYPHVLSEASDSGGTSRGEVRNGTLNVKYFCEKGCYHYNQMLSADFGGHILLLIV